MFVRIVRSEVFTEVTMKNAVFWDVAQCRSCVNRRFGGTYRLHLQGRKIRERGTSVSRWLQFSRYVPPKRRFTQDLHGTTSQKMALFFVTIVLSCRNAFIFTGMWYGLTSMKTIVTSPTPSTKEMASFRMM
jgi:hypothetical protein